MFSIIAALDKNGGIGNMGDLPWPKLKGDMKFYRELTSCPDSLTVENRYALRDRRIRKSFSSFKGFINFLKNQNDLPSPQEGKRNAVVMGRRTWDSLPVRFKPLPNRLNVVLSKRKQEMVGKDVVMVQSLEQALERLSSNSTSKIFVIGGGSVYEESIQHPECAALYLTQIEDIFHCDTYFPKFQSTFILRATGHSVQESGISYKFTVFDRSFSSSE